MQKIFENPVMYSVAAAAMTLCVGLVSYALLEPSGVLGATTDEFIVTQDIGAEVSFTAAPNDVIMRTPAGSTQIGAVTGGTSYGTTSARVYTNSTGGYTLTINFASTTAMILNGGGAWIDNHTSGTPSFHDPAVQDDDAFFAFTASSSNLDSQFEYSGSSCAGTGSFSTSTCWFMPSDAETPTTLVNNGSPTAGGGELTDINFVVAIGSNNTDLPNGTYTATATLTAAPQ